MVSKFFRNLYDDYSTEKMIVVFLNEAGEVIHKMEFTENINDGVRFELDEISLNITKVKPYACIVAHNALGIESDCDGVVHERWKCLKTYRTTKKFVGTAMAYTPSGASSRLKPTQRKKLSSAMCRQ